MFDIISLKRHHSIQLAITLLSLIGITLANYLLTSKIESNANIVLNRCMPAINSVLNADKIRHLRQKTQDSTGSIQTMVALLQSGISNAMSHIDNGFGKVSNIVELSEETGLSRAKILTSVAAVTDDINQNLHSLNEKIIMT